MASGENVLWIVAARNKRKATTVRVFRTREAARVWRADKIKRGLDVSRPTRATWGPEQ